MVHALAFSPDGRSLLTGSDAARVFIRAAELPDDLGRVANLIEVVTAMTLDPRQGGIQLLDNAGWLASRERLAQAGGTPLLPVPSRTTADGRSVGLVSAVLQARSQTALADNNSAWKLATSADPTLRDPGRAVELARHAIKLEPKRGIYWNTLGTALYRAGDLREANEALRRANELEARASLGFNAYFLAMAYRRQGEAGLARTWFDIAGRWHRRVAPSDEELKRFRAEAAGVLGLSTEAASSAGPLPADDATLARLILQADPSAAWARTWLVDPKTGLDRAAARPAATAMPTGPEAFGRP
jgi:tetratricopeptide (TPR) repeat protein